MGVPGRLGPECAELVSKERGLPRRRAVLRPTPHAHVAVAVRQQVGARARRSHEPVHAQRSPARVRPRSVPPQRLGRGGLLQQRAASPRLAHGLCAHRKAGGVRGQERRPCPLAAVVVLPALFPSVLRCVGLRRPRRGPTVLRSGSSGPRGRLRAEGALGLPPRRLARGRRSHALVRRRRADELPCGSQHRGPRARPEVPCPGSHCGFPGVVA
mmetsp:Transcript_3247/g.13336  ORF Transcript_3247/g.13336 Transcript_3247/m.13336 type:complete len:213 (-) Transcript_3247:92-730(-)